MSSYPAWQKHIPCFIVSPVRSYALEMSLMSAGAEGSIFFCVSIILHLCFRTICTYSLELFFLPTII
ncbi:hypothetical protein L1887_33729 [Cichorium endivia]|nr:hypothetical protein L1887_33729 [Cichorium endivia]